MEGAEASAPQLAIRRIEQKYRALVDSLSEGVWAVDVRGGTTFANRQLGSILGYSMEDMREKTLADFLQPADIATLFGPARDVPRQAERTLAAADGRRVTVLLSTAPLTDGTGAFSGLVATIVDITERRMLEAREEMTRAAAAAIGDSLDENDTARRLASALVQSFADWVLIALADPDAEGAAASFALHRDPAQQGVVDAIAAYPARCAALSGPAVTNGRPVLLSPITPAIIEAQTGDDAYRRLIAAADAHSAVIVPIRNGTRTNLGAFVCVRTGSRPAFIVDDVACLERVAGRAALVIENARLFRAAQEANRRKDEFIARFSHELRTPLTAILGWTRILQSRRVDEAQRRHALEVVERSARIQNELVRDILDVTKISAGKIRLERRAVDLACLVEGAVEAVRPGADERQLRLRFAASANGVVDADPTRLDQIVWNLVNNAIKFTPAGGRVDVTLQAPEPGRIEIQVRDDGTGISREFLPHVFDKFRQSDPAGSHPGAGLGLGLAIVKHLVEIHGGWITAHSDGEGRGALFTVSLPLAGQHAGDQRPVA